VIWRDHPLCAPADRWPTVFWGPEPLDAEAWRAFSSRLDVAGEAAVLDRELSDAGSLLDVGGGLGTVTRRLHLGGRRCVLVDPTVPARGTISAEDGTPIEMVPGRAEALPFEDGSFDAVVATWILQYTGEPMRAVAEMIRVAAARARVLIVQAHPDNPIVRCYNACAAVLGRPGAHHGFLLASAAAALAERGFTSIELTTVPAFVAFDATSEREREQLAATIVDLHFAGSSDRAAMLERAREILFDTEAVAVGSARRAAIADHGVLLIGRR
jgi:ubiquinone/menaquinone biosynthesis C-methylase UbiE